MEKQPEQILVHSQKANEFDFQTFQMIYYYNIFLSYFLKEKLKSWLF